jgi:hypothetical protein
MIAGMNAGIEPFRFDFSSKFSLSFSSEVTEFICGIAVFKIFDPNFFYPLKNLVENRKITLTENMNLTQVQNIKS